MVTKIPMTDLREIIGKITLNRNPTPEELDAIYGIELIKRVSGSSSSTWRCGDYVFGTVKKEQWYSHKAVNRARINPHGFLDTRGYEEVYEPQEGDVVAYKFKKGDVQHWGLVENVDSGLIIVRSKFDAFSIYRHDLECVPSRYGEDVIFFRRAA
jgi:hypothetical protein